MSVGRNEAASPYPAFHFAGVLAPKQMDLTSRGTLGVADGLINSPIGGMRYTIA
jgi:hypothetical protein